MCRGRCFDPGTRAVVVAGARLDAGCIISPDCKVGEGAYLGPGAMLLDRPRLPGSEAGKPAEVGPGIGLGGGAVVCGDTVGRNAIVAAGEVVEDGVPDGVCGWGAG